MGGEGEGLHRISRAQEGMVTSLFYFPSAATTAITKVPTTDHFPVGCSLLPTSPIILLHPHQLLTVFIALPLPCKDIVPEAALLCPSFVSVKNALLCLCLCEADSCCYSVSASLCSCICPLFQALRHGLAW